VADMSSGARDVPSSSLADMLDLAGLKLGSSSITYMKQCKINFQLRDCVTGGHRGWQDLPSLRVTAT
jgi:hypothetical protein